MAKTIIGKTLPSAGTIAAPIKGLIAVVLASGGTVSARVPAPSPISINGVASPLIDLRAMSLSAVAAFINAMGCGARATVNTNGQIVLDNITSIDGEPDLLTILGLI